MPRLYTAILTRNEASPDRYLRKVLGRCREFSDAVLVLDDGSTDGTPQLARRMDCAVRQRQSGVPAWGAESSARAELWDFACEHATEPDDWVLICDADMELRGDPRLLCESEEVNAWCFILYDAWSATHYRADGFWRGHEIHRPWLFAPNRVPEGWVPSWPDRGLHVGHCPQNFPIYAGIAPILQWWYIHWAYSSPALRAAKHAQYAAKSHLLTDFERAHAASILTAP